MNEGIISTPQEGIQDPNTRRERALALEADRNAVEKELLGRIIKAESGIIVGESYSLGRTTIKIGSPADLLYVRSKIQLNEAEKYYSETQGQQSETLKEAVYDLLVEMRARDEYLRVMFELASKRKNERSLINGDSVTESVFDLVSSSLNTPRGIAGVIESTNEKWQEMKPAHGSSGNLSE